MRVLCTGPLAEAAASAATVETVAHADPGAAIAALAAHPFAAVWWCGAPVFDDAIPIYSAAGKLGADVTLVQTLDDVRTAEAGLPR